MTAFCRAGSYVKYWWLIPINLDHRGILLLYHCVFVWLVLTFTWKGSLHFALFVKFLRELFVICCIFYLRLALFSNDRSKSVFDDLLPSRIVSKTSVLGAEIVNEKTFIRHNRISKLNSVNSAIRITAVILSFVLFQDSGIICCYWLPYYFPLCFTEVFSHWE